MTDLLDRLATENRATRPKDRFEPIARYYPEMDLLLFLNEECSYRSDRIDPFLTVLWHSKDERLVGLKLKGFRFIFEQAKSILELREDAFLPLVKAIEIALVGSLGELMMKRAEKDRIERLRDRYEQAKQLAKKISVPPDEWKRAA